MIVVVYVYDIIAVGSDCDCEWFREALTKAFPVNNLGPLRRYTGCDFEHNEVKGTVKIIQTAFIEKFIEHIDVTPGRSISADPCVKLMPKEDDEPEGNWPNRQAVRCLT